MEAMNSANALSQTPNKQTPRPRLRRFLRFSLRGLLLLILVLSVWLAWQVNRAHEQRRALARIHELGGSVWFDYQEVKTHTHQEIFRGEPKKEPPAPEWLRNLVGEEYFRDVISIQLNKTPTRDEDLWILDNLPKVERLWLGETQITDQGVEKVARALPRLKGLGLDKTVITDHGLSPLSTLQHLEQLNLWQCSIGDDGMQYLSPLTKMRQLFLEGTEITDAGLIHLANMYDIDEWLGLCCPRITDAGLKHLTHLKKAKSINLLRSRVTPKGGEWLSQQLPKCHVSY